MKLSIAALAMAFAMPAGAAIGPAPSVPAQPVHPAFAQAKDPAAKPAPRAARDDCRTPRKAKAKSRDPAKV